MAIDLKNVEKVNPNTSGSPQVKPLDGIQKAGYNLAIWVLIIIASYILFIIIMFFAKDFDGSVCKDCSLDKDAFERLSAEKKAYRDFLTQMSQMILLNLLLPTLTAILGYIFGSREGKTS